MSVLAYQKQEDRESIGLRLACPPDRLPNGDSNSQAVLRWFMEAKQMGLEFLKNERAFQDIDRAIETFAGIVNDKIPRKLSRVRANVIKRDVQELIAIQSNVRPFWQYESDNPALEQTCGVITKLNHNWFYDTFADRAIKGALQYAATSVGYIEPYWDPNFHRVGKGDIALRVRGPKEVMPVHMGKHNDLQRAYAVIIKESMPVLDAIRNWPEYQDQLKPTRWPSSLGKMADSMFSWPMLAWMQRGNKEREKESFPMLDVYYVYVNDWSINDTGQARLMGQPGEPWCYEVPAFGDPILNGYHKDGSPRYRAATQTDAYLYPNRRLIICTDTCVLYDGPSRWWHGRVPIVKFSIDGWIWDYLGYSLVRNVQSLQDSAVSLMRAVDDAMNGKLNPMRFVNKNAGLSKGDAERLNPRIPGQMLYADLEAGQKPIEFPLGPDYYSVPNNLLQFIESMMQRIDHDLGIPDVRSLAKAKQIPGSDTVQAIMDLSGPLAEDMTREMERSLRELGHQVKYFFYEFYTAAHRYQILGELGITPADMDVDAGSMVPAHMPDEDPEAPSRYTKTERARYYADLMTFKVVPNSLNNITSTTEKLFMVQLAKGGILPIDWWTIAKKLGINIGNEPPNTNTPLERYIYQKTQVETQIMAAQTEAQVRVQMEARQAMQGGGVAQEGAEGGRPQSFQSMPRQVSKDQGTRSVTTTAPKGE